MPNVSIPIAVKNADTILQRISNGERLMDIAPDYGVSVPAISMALRQHLPDRYDEALRNQIEEKLAIYEEQLETARDGLTISRARELLAHTRWKLERRNPAKWGQAKQAVQVNAGDGQVQVNIVSWSDGEPAA